jgi:hypothetical protein
MTRALQGARLLREGACFGEFYATAFKARKSRNSKLLGCQPVMYNLWKSPSSQEKGSRK